MVAFSRTSGEDSSSSSSLSKAISMAFSMAYASCSHSMSSYFVVISPGVGISHHSQEDRSHEPLQFSRQLLSLLRIRVPPAGHAYEYT